MKWHFHPHDDHPHFHGRHGRGPHRGHGPHGFLGRFGRGGPMGGGKGMRAARMLASGDLQLIVLSLLKEKPRHGYEVIKALEEHSSGVYTPSPGVIYPAFTYLEEMDYASSQAEGNKKLYSITPAGEKYLEENRQLVDETMEHLALFGKRMAYARSFMNESEEEAMDSDESWEQRMDRKREWRKTKMEFRALKEELKEAILENIDASIEERDRIFKILRKAIAEIRGK